MPTAKEVYEAGKLTNHFAICLDRSGSMGSIRQQAIKTFNSNVQAILAGAKNSGQKSTVTLTTFGGDIRYDFLHEDPSSLRELTSRDYSPNGGTPLLDAVGTTIDKLSEVSGARDDNTSFMFIIITDGAENTSHIYNGDSLSRKLRDVQRTDRWSFAFLLPPGTAREFSHQFGIPEGNVQEWEATDEGIRGASVAVSQGISNYYTSRSMGQRSTKGFFTTDMSHVSSSEVRSKLTDVQHSVIILEVPRECEIRGFCESQGLPYRKGCAFYQLTKNEKIQASKQILLVEKGRTAVYMGADARSILQLPDYNVEVRPGNHSNWDIFVQSTSVNRKLVRGTKLVYLK